jgi:hypothetical protein
MLAGAVGGIHNLLAGAVFNRTSRTTINNLKVEAICSLTALYCKKRV